MRAGEPQDPKITDNMGMPNVAAGGGWGWMRLLEVDQKRKRFRAEVALDDGVMVGIGLVEGSVE